MDEPTLVMRLRQAEADLAPPDRTPDGVAGPDARERIVARLEATALTDPPMEHHFQVKDPVQRRLLTALLRRYDLVPYRYPRQSDKDVMVRMPMSWEAQVFDPLHRAVKAELQAFHLASLDRVAGAALHWDTSDAGENVDDVPRTRNRQG